MQYRMTSLAVQALGKSKISLRYLGYPLDTNLLSLKFPQFIKFTLHLFPRKDGLSPYKSTMSLETLMATLGTVIAFVGRMGLSLFPYPVLFEKNGHNQSWAKIINPKHLPGCTQPQIIFLTPFTAKPLCEAARVFSCSPQWP